MFRGRSLRGGPLSLRMIDSAYELISGSSPARQPTSSNEQASVPEDDRVVENKRDLEYGFEGICVCGRSQVHQDDGDTTQLHCHLSQRT